MKLLDFKDYEIAIYYGKDLIQGFHKDTSQWCYKLYQFQLFRFGIVLTIDRFDDCENCFDRCC